MTAAGSGHPAAIGDPVPLDPGERATLARLLALVLPSTSGAGAAEASALDHLLRRLDGPEAGSLPELRALLASVKDREELELERLCASDDPWFTRLRAWAWEGFLCDPALGGNRDGVGWQRFGARRHRQAASPRRPEPPPGMQAPT